MGRLLPAHAAALVLCCAASVHAASPIDRETTDSEYAPAPTPTAPPEADTPGSSRDAPRASVPNPMPLERPFSFVPDPSLAAPYRPFASYSAAYSARNGGSRPLAATASRAGLINELRVEMAVADRVAPFAAGLWAPSEAGESGARLAANAGLRLLLSDPLSRAGRLLASAGYLRDFSNANGGFVELSASWDWSRVRVAAMGHAERVFAEDRDAIDLYTAAAVSYRVASTLRAGAEYVAQDLEGAWEPNEAEGGLRHFAAGTLAWTNASSSDARLFLVLSPAIGLNQASPALLGRATLSYLF